MTELSERSDAPSDSPPAPPPAETDQTTPDVTPELASAVADERERPDQPETPTAPDRVPEPERGSADLPEERLPQPEASAELQSAITEGPDTTPGVPVTAEPAGGDADLPSADRPDIASRYPADYVPSADPPPTVEGPHESPEGWAADVNPDRDAPGRDTNCGECARAVDSTWHGDPAAAAAMSDDGFGENPSRMAEWAGQAPTEVSMPDVQQRLEDLGPGSSAVVGFDREDGGGHWFNAVNDEGTIKAVDGQSGLVETWPPTDEGLGFSETDMSYSDAVFFTADGKVVR